jgi:FAD/FMN-containing dehydrogenase
MAALVMLFDEELSPAGDARMEAVTRELIDAALACDGRYYLPYRLQATRDQFERSYPMARAWAAKKAEYDPTGLFGNRFFDRYVGP